VLQIYTNICTLLEVCAMFNICIMNDICTVFDVCTGTSHSCRLRRSSVDRTGWLAWGVGIKIVKSLVGNLPADIDMASIAGRRGKLAQNTVAKVQPRSTIWVPNGAAGRSGAASLASVSDEQGKIRLNTVDGNEDFASAVQRHVSDQLRVVHGNHVVRVDLVETEAGVEVTLDVAKVLVREVGAACLHLFDVVVVGTEPDAGVDDVLGLGGEGEEQRCCGGGDGLHVGVMYVLYVIYRKDM
jgi:hypothetical protein